MVTTFEVPDTLEVKDLDRLDLPDDIKQLVKSTFLAKTNGQPGPFISDEAFTEMTGKFMALRKMPSEQILLIHRSKKGLLCFVNQ